MMNLAENGMSAIDSERLHTFFSQLDVEQVETFYKSYQHWHLEQQCVALEEQRAALEQQIVDNQVLLHLTQPSPIALATLTRLQSLGVDDVDLLDGMLERGDTWLDHALQLLEQCERLDVIHGNYTEWCRHALEDAYDWLDSIHEVAQPETEQTTQAETNDDATEALLLQKLMSEDETVRTSALKPTMSEPIHDIYEANEPVGTDVSRPSGRVDAVEDIDPLVITPNEINGGKGRDVSVPTAAVQRNIPVPSVLSYAMKAETNSLATTEPQEEHKKSPKYGLMSRILASVWHT